MDREIRSLRKALERTGRFRFVALMSVGRYPEKPARGCFKVTVATRCGADGYRNLSRTHYWGLPVLTLEDLAELQKTLRVEWLFDLELRTERLIHQRVAPHEDFREDGWPSFELEEDWGDTTFAMNCTVRDLRKRFGAELHGTQDPRPVVPTLSEWIAGRGLDRSVLNSTDAVCNRETFAELGRDLYTCRVRPDAVEDQ